MGKRDNRDELGRSERENIYAAEKGNMRANEHV